MAGIGGTNMENRGIDYRERSPLVVPPKLDLPPPESCKSEIKDPNWPKDPDEARRKAAIAARKKGKPRSSTEAARPLTPSELNVGRTAAPARTNNDPVAAGRPSQSDAEPVAARLYRRSASACSAAARPRRRRSRVSRRGKP